MAPTIIIWPTGDRRMAIKRKFRKMAGVDNVIGVVDGTFVPIKAPLQNPESYVTRKCNYAFTLQGICDSSLKYIDAFTGFPGSVSDTRIFSNSDIYKSVITNTDHYFPDNEFIIGDKAYPPLNWCVPPYINRGRLNNRQRYFNLVISQTR
jgi:hypothetical protein